MYAVLLFVIQISGKPPNFYSFRANELVQIPLILMLMCNFIKSNWNISVNPAKCTVHHSHPQKGYQPYQPRIFYTASSLNKEENTNIWE